MSTQNVENVLTASQQMALIEANLPADVFSAVQDASKNTSPGASFDDVAAVKLAEYAKRGYAVQVTVVTP